MKKFEYVYFTLYHYCSRNSYFPDALSTRLKSLYVLALSVGGWILLLQSCFLRFVRNAWFTSHPGAMLYALVVYAAITWGLYRILIVNEGDQKIWEKYADAWHHNPNKKRDLMFAFLAAAAPYILMMLVKVLFPR